MDLNRMLANRRWERRLDPFPHYVARDVFTSETYQRLENAFQEYLDRGFSETMSDTRFSRNIPGYDAFSLPFWNDSTGPFELFLSRHWHDMLARLVGIDATGDINAALHHHGVNSKSGWVHNDLNPGWFIDLHREDGTNPSSKLVNYHHGNVHVPGSRARETIRAVAVLYYLNNAPWSAGDGGETGLFLSAEDTTERPVAAVPPINNSILIFECTPHSYHSFVRNVRNPRNSLIMWLHRTKEEVVNRWGEDKIVKWPVKR